MSVREQLEDASGKMMRVYEGVTVVLFFLMVFVTLLQIGNRLIPVTPPIQLNWTAAWAVRLMLLTSFFGIGVVHYYREDIEIGLFKDWVKSRAPDAAARLYQIVLDAALLFTMGLLALITYDFGVESLDVNPSPVYFEWFSQGYFSLALATGFGIAFVVALMRALTDLYRLVMPIVRPLVITVREQVWR